MAWSVGSRTFRTRAQARAYAKQTGQRATGEYRARIERGTAGGKSRSEARGHPFWEPLTRPTSPSRGKRKHRRPDVLVGRPSHEGEPLPEGAALRGLRAWIKANPGEPNVVVSVHGLPATGQSIKRRQGMSLRIRAKMSPGGGGPEGALWFSQVRPVEELLEEMEYDDLAALYGSEDSGLPAMAWVDQVEYSVPA